MRHRILRIVVVTSLFAVCLLANQPLISALTVTDLGTLGEPHSNATAINNSGQVVGWSRAVATVNDHAFLWQNGTMIDLGTLGGSISRAWGINDAGQVVGSSTIASGETHAFLWQTGTMVDLGTLGGNFSAAFGINDLGQIVGSSDPGGGDEHAFLWQNGTMTDLGTLGGSVSVANGINDLGEIVGYSHTPDSIRAFHWQGGSMQALPTLGGLSFALGINDLGQIVGRSDIGVSPGNQPRAVLWQNGSIVNLGTLGGTVSIAAGINELGQVVGNSMTAAGQSHAFLWQNGSIVDLGGLGGTAGDANGINNLSQIAGTSSTATNLNRATLWSGPFPTGDTQIGSNVALDPVDSTTGTSPVSITFDTVTSSGTTSLTTSGTGPPPPNGFKLGSPPVYYDLSTTATFSGSITVCIAYSEASFRNESNIRLSHHDGNGWVDITLPGYPDTLNDIVCGSTTSLSPFALFEPGYAFDGFFSPVDNQPTFNKAKPGSAIPIKFSLNGDQGLDIFVAGYPSSGTIACEAGATTDTIESTITAGSSSLSYDATTDTYTYVWKTEKSWTGCRQLVLLFADDTEVRANFDFRK